MRCVRVLPLLASCAVLCGAGVPEPRLGIAWGFLYGYEGVKAETYMPQVRRMGAGMTKVYLLWNQVEPEKGRFDWTAVDAFVNQLQSPEEGLISIFSSSQWATRRASHILPPSPARNPDDYYRFINTLVRHCKGRVRYWENDAEPNNPIFWSGTKQEFVDELKVFHKAVKDADPAAIVVAGGYDGLFNPPGMFQFPDQKRGLDFFDFVISEGSTAFDAFDLRLYGDPYTIPYRVDHIRQMMKDHGVDKPIICGEYNGPGFFEFPANLAHVAVVLKWTRSITGGDEKGPATDQGQNEVAALYAKMSSLPPQTQMFMEGCPPELQKKLERLQARDLVMRNVLAFSAGVQSTLFWDLWHDTSQRNDIMHLMYSKLKLLEYDDGALRRRYPLADAFERMADALRGLTTVKRIALEGKPSIFLLEVRKRNGPPVYVVWDKRDTLSGEDAPAISFDMTWDAAGARAVDALGQALPVTVQDGRLKLAVSVTPVFVTQ